MALRVSRRIPRFSHVFSQEYTKKYLFLENSSMKNHHSSIHSPKVAESQPLRLHFYFRFPIFATTNRHEQVNHRSLRSRVHTASHHLLRRTQCRTKQHRQHTLGSQHRRRDAHQSSFQRPQRRQRNGTRSRRQLDLRWRQVCLRKSEPFGTSRRSGSSQCRRNQSRRTTQELRHPQRHHTFQLQGRQNLHRHTRRPQPKRNL